VYDLAVAQAQDARTGATMGQSLQERYAAGTSCFGCGPSNPSGLRIRSFIEDGEGICDFLPATHHEAFDGFVAGGIIGVVFDCHSNWTAAHHLMMRTGAESPPATVTAEYTVRFAKPTPSGGQLRFRARVVESTDSRATVDGVLEAGGAVTATCRAIFVAVGEGHPAFRRW
jgi:acyl-coenzyme A thioesterase PaaI-like protein